MRAGLVRQRRARNSSSFSACSRPTRRRNRWRSSSARRSAPFKPTRIACHFAYLGGGFGGRDHTPFPLYVALAAMFFPGRPVRLAHDRFQQFQGGIKRNAFTMRRRSASSGRPARSSRSPPITCSWRRARQLLAQVATVGACAALGIYYVPKVDITTVALHSRGVTAGSMRGYGTLQTMTALEVLVDEICTALPLDPIEFRRRNALKDGGRTITGNPYIVSVRTPEILDKLEKHPIWQQRAAEKARGQQGGNSSAPASPAPPRTTAPARTPRLRRVTIDPDGRITIHSDYVEMGNGIGTAIANRVASHLGARVRRNRPRADQLLRRPRTGDLRRSLHDDAGDAGRRAAQPALGSGDQLGLDRLDRRPCRNASGGRGGARRVPLRIVAGGARIVGHRAERSAGEAMGSRALEGRAAHHARARAARAGRRSQQRPTRRTA